MIYINKKKFLFSGSWMEKVDDLTDLMANIVESNSSEIALKLFNVLHPYDKPLPNIDEDEDVIKISTEKLMNAGAIPNISVLDKLSSKVKAIVIGHAHLDHVGAVPYLAPCNPKARVAVGLSDGSMVRTALAAFHKASVWCRLSSKAYAAVFETVRVELQIPREAGSGAGSKRSTPVEKGSTPCHLEIRQEQGRFGVLCR